MSRTKHKTNSFVEYFKHILPSEGRVMIGMAAKIILSPRHWDYSGNVKPFIINGHTYETHPSVIDIFTGFTSINSQMMKINDDFIISLKRMANYNPRLNKCSKRMRCRHLARMRDRLRKDFYKAHLQNKIDCISTRQEKATGIKYAIRSIKIQFLG